MQNGGRRYFYRAGSCVFLLFLLLILLTTFLHPASRSEERAPEASLQRGVASARYDNLSFGIPGKADCIVDREGFALGYIEYHEQLSRTTRLGDLQTHPGRAPGESGQADKPFPGGSGNPHRKRNKRRLSQVRVRPGTPRSRRRHGVFRANNGGQLFLFQHESASSCI